MNHNPYHSANSTIPQTTPNIIGKSKISGPFITTILAFFTLFINLLVSNGIILIALVWILFKSYNSLSLDSSNIQNTIMDIVMQLSQNGLLVSLTVISGATSAILFIWFIGWIDNKKNILRFLQIQKFKKKDFAIWLSIYILYMIASEFTGRYFNRPEVPEFMIGLICNPGSYILLFIAIAIFAPAFEELLFRGYWYQGYVNTRPGLIAAILIPNLVWASIHLQYDLYDITQIFLIGIILGASRYFSGSLALPILLHTIQNSVAFFASVYTIQCT